MDDKYTRICAEDFINYTQKHPKFLPAVAKKLKVTREWFMFSLKEGNVFYNGYGNFIIK